jgi:hypothetical protein
MHLNSSVIKVTGYGLEDWDSIPDMDRDFSLAITSRLALGPTQPPILGNWGLFHQGKATQM